MSRPASAATGLPVVVLVADPWAGDRDGNQAAAPTRDLHTRIAWALAQRGVAALRYDHRGLETARGSVGLPAATFDDFALDAKAAAMSLADDQRFSLVIAAGHGEAAGLALRAANAGAPIDGVMLLATGARPLSPAAATFDPVAEITRVPVPVLIVHGRRDTTVPERDAEPLFRARPDARFVVLAGADHMFEAVVGRETVAGSSPDRVGPVASDLIDVLVDWIRSLR